MKATDTGLGVKVNGTDDVVEQLLAAEVAYIDSVSTCPDPIYVPDSPQITYTVLPAELGGVLGVIHIPLLATYTSVTVELPTVTTQSVEDHAIVAELVLPIDME